MFKFFAHIAFQIEVQSHLTQNRSWRESKLTPSILHLCYQFLCRRIPRSSLAVHFHANVLSGMVGADAEFSERGGSMSPAEAMDCSEKPEEGD
jgi:hypothetical protein